MLNQGVYWGLLILAAFTLLLLMIPERPKQPSLAAGAGLPRAEDRVARWQALLDLAEQNEEARSILLQELKSLQQSTGLPVDETQPVEMSLPPVRKGFAGTIANSPILGRFQSRLGWRRSSALEEWMDQVLNSMETQMEMKSDRTANHSDDR